MLSGNLSQDQLHILTEAHVQHLICLIQYHHVHQIQFDGMSAHVIHDASRSAYDDLHTPQTRDLAADVLSAVYGKHFDPVHIFCDFTQFFRCLNCQFSGRAQDDRL